VKLPRWLPIVVFAAFGAGAIACAVDDGDLNPQPLPPGPEDQKGGGSSGEVASGASSSGTFGGATSGGSSSGGSSSGLSANPSDYSDAGASVDGGDAGDAGDVEAK
jgi:hypothetical protein